MIRGAVLSDCERYRYALWRAWEVPSHPPMCSPTCWHRLLFIGLNPSTADDTIDDATVCKWTGFAKRWGYTGFTAVNLFAWRATDPRELAVAGDPRGSINPTEITARIMRANLIVPCWGAITKLPPALRHVPTELAAQLRIVRLRRVECFGLTRGGDPKHPLMLPYSTSLQPWPIRPSTHQEMHP